jgi:hypothetical protein
MQRICSECKGLPFSKRGCRVCGGTGKMFSSRNRQGTPTARWRRQPRLNKTNSEIRSRREAAKISVQQRKQASRMFRGF